MSPFRRPPRYAAEGVRCWPRWNQEEDALALGQMNYQGARWAAVNTCATKDEIMQYILF